MLGRTHCGVTSYEYEDCRAAPRSGSENLQPQRQLDQFGIALHAQRFHRLVLVVLDRAVRDVEQPRDLLGRAAVDQQLQDLALARCQPEAGSRAGRWPAEPSTSASISRLM
jgi:hypothetical protein